MKILKIIRTASIIVGFIGVVMFLGTLTVDSDGILYDIIKMDALACIAIHILIAIWLQAATIHHILLVKKWNCLEEISLLDGGNR